MPDWQPPKTDAELIERVERELAKPERDAVEVFAGTGFTAHRGSKPRTFPTYAHFPGTGPAGEHCRDCNFVRARRAAKGRVPVCGKAKMLNPAIKLSQIDGRAPACRYFEIRAGKVADE